MSARAQQLPVMTASAFALTPILHVSQTQAAPSPFGLPGGQVSARTFPVIVATNGPFTSYPPKHSKEDDERLLYTYASFHEEPFAALNNRGHHNWVVCVLVPIPNIKNPALLALHYMIKYATTCDNGNSTIQTDTILTTEALQEGLVTQNTELSVYHQDESGSAGFAPSMIDHEEALRLSTTLAVKCNDGGEQWSHYIDNQYITPNVRAFDDCHLYVVFRVSEYPSMQTARSLSVKVSATWQKEEVELKAIAAAKKEAEEEAERQAKLEDERRAREAEERQAKKEEREGRQEERRATKEEHQARKEEHQARQEEKRAKEENSVAHAPAVADANLRARINRVIEEKITFAQLGM
ncbi:hypothetical protein M413DRAFT_444432, partial [Hebeloma cylindrosporum]